MKKKILTLSIFILFGVPFNSYADRRSYVWTYEYMTMPKARAEVEYYFSAKIPDSSNPGVNSMEHQIEFEYGITDHWDVSIYQQLQQNNRAKESDLSYKGFKVRTRYRFGEKGQFFLDPLLYFEYKRSADFSEPNEIEAKVILAKDIGNFNVSYNQVLEQVAESSGGIEHEYTFGINYASGYGWGIGLESKGNYTEDKYALGPTVSFGLDKFWFTLGSVFALNNKTDDIVARFIVGIPL